jgi:hypothetical protein
MACAKAASAPATGAREIIDKLPVIEGDAGHVFTTNGKTQVSGFWQDQEEPYRHMLAIAQDDAKKAGRDPATVSIAPWRLHDMLRTAKTHGGPDISQGLHCLRQRPAAGRPTSRSRRLLIEPLEFWYSSPPLAGNVDLALAEA